MADAKNPIDQTPKRRIIKDPETFREKAIKAAEGSDKPGRASVVRTGVGKVTGPVFRPVGKASKKAASVPPFRWLGKFPPFQYIAGSVVELKQVKWPNWKTARQLTFAVIIFATIFGVIIAIVDFGLDKLFRDILLK